LSFQKFSGGDTPRPSEGESATPPTRNTQLIGLWPGAGGKRPGLKTQILVPLNFSAIVKPLYTLYLVYVNDSVMRFRSFSRKRNINTLVTVTVTVTVTIEV